MEVHGRQSQVRGYDEAGPYSIKKHELGDIVKLVGSEDYSLLGWITSLCGKEVDEL